MLVLPLVTAKPCISLLFFELHIKELNTSAHISKRLGDNGSPYLKPLQGRLDLLGLPFTNMA